MSGFYVTIDDSRRPALGTSGGSDLLNVVFFSLATPRGSWFFDKTLGSRLYLLRKEKCLPRTEQLVRDYIGEALQWLIDIGRVIKADVTTERLPALGRIRYTVKVYGANEEQVSYTNFVRVA